MLDGLRDAKGSGNTQMSGISRNQSCKEAVYVVLIEGSDLERTPTAFQCCETCNASLVTSEINFSVSKT